MPLTEPRSPWASTHGEKTSIPTTRIDLAKFGIGKLLSCERLTPNTSANCPVPSHLKRILRGSRTKSSLMLGGPCNPYRGPFKDTETTATSYYPYPSTAADYINRAMHK